MKKVLSYLQLMQNTTEEIRFGVEIMKKGFIKPDWDYSNDEMIRVPDFESFYSQPFRPEMIVELFAGWRIIYNANNTQHHKIYNYDKEIEITYTPSPKQELTIYSYTTLFWTYEPRTLDDFICDTQRTNIELEWKKCEN